LKRDVKDKILKRLEEQAAQQGQQGQQQQQMAAAMADQQAQKLQSETAKNMSLAQKTGVEAQRLALGY
jgi:hypothetical protein